MSVLSSRETHIRNLETVIFVWKGCVIHVNAIFILKRAQSEQFIEKLSKLNGTMEYMRNDSQDDTLNIPTNTTPSDWRSSN